MRERLINAALVLVSLLLTYLVLDFGVLHHFIDRVPLRLNGFLGRAMIFGQSSKAGPIPHDYIAVLGDSYAEGVGDWLLEVGNHGNPDFQATHVLHRITGRDVITFGKGGTGQLENLVVLPVEAFESINDDTTFHLDPPKQIFAYFYEGMEPGLSGAEPKSVEEESARLVMEFVSSGEGAQLLDAFMQIGDAKIRKRMLNLVGSLAQEEPVEPDRV